MGVFYFLTNSYTRHKNQSFKDFRSILSHVLSQLFNKFINLSYLLFGYFFLLLCIRLILYKMTLKRISAHWISKKNIKLKKTNLPHIKDEELLLKVESCAICGSDLKIFFNGNNRVKSGQIIGHEISGSIMKIGKKVKKF